MTGLSAPGYQTALGSLSADGTLVDGNTATGPSQSSGGGPSLTGAVSLGGLVQLAGIVYTIYYENLPAPTLEYTNDGGTTWFPLTIGSPPSHGGVGSLWTDTVIATFTADYVRLSVHDLMPSTISIREIAVMLPVRRQVPTAFL